MSGSDDLKKLINEIQVLKERIEALEKLNSELVEQNEQLREENDRQQEMLSFLPADAKKQMDKKVKKTSSLRYKMVTVMFSDIKGFTQLSKEQNAEALIDELDSFFFQFDEVVARNNLQKVKSIGDTYMCAGGIPKKNRTNPIEVIMAALEMQDYLKNLQAESKKNNRKIWDLTFGVHTGPVTAVVSGKRKISYDIKGDTANIASRIESACNPSEISVSGMTYEFIKEFFACEFRLKMPVKYKGDVPVYMVKGYRPDLSVDGRGKIPNKAFRTKFQIIKFEDLNDYVLDRLERELPKH
ncbi:MAG: hypothetical protein L3J56_03585 [Bacteroidales bacterium]|nr:hypothetical protein [Bacteroidales bacterium]